MVNIKIYSPTFESILTSLGHQTSILIPKGANICLLLTSMFRHLPQILMSASMLWLL